MKYLWAFGVLALCLEFTLANKCLYDGMECTENEQCCSDVCDRKKGNGKCIPEESGKCTFNGMGCTEDEQCCSEVCGKNRKCISEGKPTENRELKSCKVTACDMEGPFYEPGAKMGFKVAPKAEWNGEKALLIEGQIRNKECQPVEGAKVSIWYAGFRFNNSANYTFPGKKHWPLYRGWVSTDSDGHYLFEATYPLIYTIRPIAHVHFKVLTDYEHVTQLYFEDDIPPTFENCTNVNRLVHPYINHQSSDKKSKVIFNINTSTGLTKVNHTWTDGWDENKMTLKPCGKMWDKKHQGKPCWKQCGQKEGQCNYCGAKGRCNAKKICA